MAEEIKNTEKKMEKKVKTVSTKEVKPTPDNKVEIKATTQEKTENKEVKVEEVKEVTVEKEKKESKKVISKKEEAVANINDVRASQKHCMYICSFIKGQKIDDAIKGLGEVIKLKRAIKFKGEIPHRKGNMMSGRYPIDASKIVISILKGLKGNVIVNQMDLDKTRITTAFATQAHRPARAGGIKAKRCHIYLIAKEIQNIKKLEVKRK